MSLFSHFSMVFLREWYLFVVTHDNANENNWKIEQFLRDKYYEKRTYISIECFPIQQLPWIRYHATDFILVLSFFSGFCRFFSSLVSFTAPHTIHSSLNFIRSFYLSISFGFLCAQKFFEEFLFIWNSENSFTVSRLMSFLRSDWLTSRRRKRGIWNRFTHTYIYIHINTDLQTHTYPQKHYRINKNEWMKKRNH